MLKPCYSNNYLCCYKCRGIPEIIIKNSEEILLNCDFCGFTEKVKINDIINISSKWIDRIYFKCSIHNHQNCSHECKYCRPCDLFICEKCKNNHINNVTGKKHEFESICDLDIIFWEKYSSKCTKYCETCKSDVCNICIKNEHKIHNIQEIAQKDDIINLSLLQNFYKSLENGKNAKIHILEKINKYFGKEKEELSSKIKLHELFKKDLIEIENYKQLGRILYFSSKKIKPGKFKEEILKNYLNIFNYICNLFKEEKIKTFNKLVQTKIDDTKIILSNLSFKDKEILKENIKNNFKSINPKVSDFIKKKSIIENNIDYSRILKKHIIIEKNKHPDNYIDIDETLNNFDKVSDGINSNNSDFILSIIGKCAQNNGTEVIIAKKQNEQFKNL